MKFFVEKQGGIFTFFGVLTGLEEAFASSSFFKQKVTAIFAKKRRLTKGNFFVII